MTRSASAAQGDQRELVSSIPFTRSPSLSMSLKQQRQRLTTTGSGVNGPATTANRMSTDNSNSKTSKDGSAHAAPTHRTKGTSLSFGSSAGRSSGSNNYIGDFDFETLLRSSETRKVSLTPSRFAQAGEGDEADSDTMKDNSSMRHHTGSADPRSASKASHPRKMSARSARATARPSASTTEDESSSEQQESLQLIEYMYEDGDEELFGLPTPKAGGKNKKKKESLMDVLNSEPPWTQASTGIDMTSPSASNSEPARPFESLPTLPRKFSPIVNLDAALGSAGNVSRSSSNDRREATTPTASSGYSIAREPYESFPVPPVRPTEAVQAGLSPNLRSSRSASKLPALSSRKSSPNLSTPRVAFSDFPGNDFADRIEPSSRPVSRLVAKDERAPRAEKHDDLIAFLRDAPAVPPLPAHPTIPSEPTTPTSSIGRAKSSGGKLRSFLSTSSRRPSLPALNHPDAANFDQSRSAVHVDEAGQLRGSLSTSPDLAVRDHRRQSSGSTPPVFHAAPAAAAVAPASSMRKLSKLTSGSKEGHRSIFSSSRGSGGKHGKGGNSASTVEAFGLGIEAEIMGAKPSREEARRFALAAAPIVPRSRTTSAGDESTLPMERQRQASAGSSERSGHRAAAAHPTADVAKEAPVRASDVAKEAPVRASRREAIAQGVLDARDNTRTSQGRPSNVADPPRPSPDDIPVNSGLGYIAQGQSTMRKLPGQIVTPLQTPPDTPQDKPLAHFTGTRADVAAADRGSIHGDTPLASTFVDPPSPVSPSSLESPLQSNSRHPYGTPMLGEEPQNSPKVVEEEEVIASPSPSPPVFSPASSSDALLRQAGGTKSVRAESASAGQSTQSAHLPPPSSMGSFKRMREPSSNSFISVASSGTSAVQDGTSFSTRGVSVATADFDGDVANDGAEVEMEDAAAAYPADAEFDLHAYLTRLRFELASAENVEECLSIVDAAMMEARFDIRSPSSMHFGEAVHAHLERPSAPAKPIFYSSAWANRAYLAILEWLSSEYDSTSQAFNERLSRQMHTTKTYDATSAYPKVVLPLNAQSRRSVVGPTSADMVNTPSLGYSQTGSVADSEYADAPEPGLGSVEEVEETAGGDETSTIHSTSSKVPKEQTLLNQAVSASSVAF